MKIPYIALAIALTTATTATAQSIWEGPYAGASVATFSGENTYDNGVDSADFELEGQMFGAFAGYNIPTNGFIVGGEISILTGVANEKEFEDEYEYTSLIDVKGRIGFDSGSFMPYAVLGASFGTLAVDDDSQPNRDFEENETGILFGLGADYAINPQFKVGVELISRNFDFEFPIDANLADAEGTVNSFALRGSYSF